MRYSAIFSREWLKKVGTTSRKAIRRGQALVRSYIPEGRSLSDELIADRRREAGCQLENDPRFLRRIEESRRSFEAGRRVRLEDVED